MIYLGSDCHGHGRSEPHAAEDRFLIWDFNHVVSQFGHYELQKHWKCMTVA